MRRIRLSGEIMEWDQPLTEEKTITASEIEAYEAQGWIVTGSQESILAIRFITPPPDGTVQIQPKSDMMGRYASAGRHTNYGYSGYFRAYVYLDGKRKNLLDFWTLFPNQEHHFDQQGHKSHAIETIRRVIAERAGTEVVQVPRGYAFDPVAHAERRASSQVAT